MSPRAKRRIRAYIVIGLITVGAAILTWFWALVPILSGFYFGPRTDEEIIRRFYPYRLIQSEWVGKTDHLLFSWSAWESGVRLLVLVALWLGGVLFVVHNHIKSKPIGAT